MDKLLICFNTPSLGGAERSMIHQALLMKEIYQLKFLVPTLDKSESSLVSFLKKHIEDKDILFVNYPISIYQISRHEAHPLRLFSLAFAFFRLFLEFRKLKFHQYQAVWLNGNKVALPFLFFSRALNFKGKIIWHHRDYLSAKFYSFASFFLFSQFNSSKRELLILANSISVQKQLKTLINIKNVSFQTLYNPSGLILKNEIKNSETEEIQTLGIVSMMAPWKGVHQILLMVKMYRLELEKIGIKRINVYGDNIYHTKGDHHGYYEQLKLLADDDFVNFKGNYPPELAFKEIDLLIHSSLKPEPFGRVILESFLFKVPVVSTAKGGASELVFDGETGIVFEPYDYSGLYFSIEKIVTNQALASKLRIQAYKKGLEIEAVVHDQIKEVCLFVANKKMAFNKEIGYGKNSTYL